MAISKEIFKGIWEVHFGHDVSGYPVFYVHGLSGPQKTDELMLKAIAELIAEAGNVYNETGLKPRELLEQRDELGKACESLLASIKVRAFHRINNGVLCFCDFCNHSAESAYQIEHTEGCQITKAEQALSKANGGK